MRRGIGISALLMEYGGEGSATPISPNAPKYRFGIGRLPLASPSTHSRKE
jgi:hypothetical protein